MPGLLDFIEIVEGVVRKSEATRSRFTQCGLQTPRDQVFSASFPPADSGRRWGRFSRQPRFKPRLPLYHGVDGRSLTPLGETGNTRTDAAIVAVRVLLWLPVPPVVRMYVSPVLVDL